MFKPEKFFDLTNHPFGMLFTGAEYVWQGLPAIKPFLTEHLNPNVSGLRRGKTVVEKNTLLYRGQVITTGFLLDHSGKKVKALIDGQVLEAASIIYAGAFLMDDQIYIGDGVIIEPSALIKGPAWIGDGSEVRHGAYIRGNVLVGHDCVVGHATEIKSSAMLGGSKAGHFAYIGDSLLGQVNLGAGTKLANLKMTSTNVSLNWQGREYSTGLRKFGAVLGDGVETGCNSVTTPGTLLAKKVLLYPNGTARGYYPENTVIKVRQSCDLASLEQEN